MPHKKIVVKVGTSSLTEHKTTLSRKFMMNITTQIAKLHENNIDILLVSSGAITCGKEIMKHAELDRSMPAKQMFSSIGQVQLMVIWRELFSSFNIHVGQLLLSRRDLSERTHYLNARDTLLCLLRHRIVPIINENDSVATREIRLGDNDNLAAYVANLVGADMLILLTDQEGLYTKDPNTDETAELIEEIDKIDEALFKMAKGTKSEFGTGGMLTKLQASEIASKSGTETIIASANREDVLLKILEGKKIGTHIHSPMNPLESRKRWLLSEKPKGAIKIDDGAKDKIVHHGASLLPSGIVQVEKGFERGDIVQIIDKEGLLLAVGITNYSKQDTEKIAGLHSSDIEKKLGYDYGHEVVHRSNMARL